jgi:hypothetical protein
VGVLIIVLGAVGLAVVLAALVDVFIDAGRKRQYLDILVVVGVAAVTVWLLFAYGDVIMQ